MSCFIYPPQLDGASGTDLDAYYVAAQMRVVAPLGTCSEDKAVIGFATKTLLALKMHPEHVKKPVAAQPHFLASLLLIDR